MDEIESRVQTYWPNRRTEFVYKPMALWRSSDIVWRQISNHILLVCWIRRLSEMLWSISQQFVLSTSCGQSFSLLGEISADWPIP
jgi:hypothetical protein